MSEKEKRDFYRWLAVKVFLPLTLMVFWTLFSIV